MEDKEDPTLTTASLGRGRESPVTAARPHLFVLIDADAPAEPSSRHSLDGIDEVRFGRGPRRVTREVIEGVRVLLVRIPDRRMSSEHGRLVHNGNAWVLDDPSSKNGAVVDGVLTRRTALRDGALLELGHTFLLLQAVVGEETRPDTTEAELAPPHPSLATFDGDLAKRYAALARIARTPISVILLGETGTGKEVVARAIHEMSQRRGAFVAVNCGALPQSLVEGELFGHRRGAFSGAVADRVGLVRSADGGTLLLDEVGELPAASQAAFLRVLQEREVTPIGDERPVKVDLRVCAATLRDLDALVTTGGFRHDLYARLGGVTIEVPALRRRRADLGMLIRTLLVRIPHGDRMRFRPEALRALLAHDWPHNIRELEKVLATAAALSPDGMIEAAHLPEVLREEATPAAAPEASGAPEAADEPDSDELKAQLVALLTVHDGNVRAVAKALGRQRTQVYRWLDRYGIKAETYRR